MATLSPERLQSAARKEASWVVGACRQFFDNRCPSLAASIAFYSAFSLAPTLVMVIAVAGWFFGDDAARGELFRQVHSVLGNDAAAGITTIVQNAHHAGNAGSVATMISISMLVIGASATFSSLNSALNIVWPPTGPRASTVFALVRVRLISFSLVLGVAFLLIVSLVLDTAITFVGHWLLGDSPYLIVGNLLQLAVGLLVLAVAFAGLLKFLPDADVRWRDSLVGGIVAAVLFSAGKKLFALYLTHAGLASAFGAAGSFAVLLMWLYFSAAVLLLGAESAAARGRMHDPRGIWGARNAPPGSRAKLASVLAASTIPAAAAHKESSTGTTLTTQGLHRATTTDHAAPVATTEAEGADSARRPVGSGSESFAAATSRARMAGGLFGWRPGAGLRIGRTIVRVEHRATHAAATTLMRAGRTVVATDRYVKRHPWGSVLLAAGAALAVTAAANHRHGATNGSGEGDIDGPGNPRRDGSARAEKPKR
ncbi:YihY/virulence factor BrkB family protein [Paraburkholderia caballeronis]|uniref:YihY/virulence factor BrkB family protein n=1 Tax=Paraburkholderia caballeronis TaxID=416943 RepID=UPI0010671083|nr:YihY/virulence factor BrkB family protein [Paraburkholderia caballeronis]TDV04950.1 membrane protein [Paraburkholderia caballeronis]TDV07997.1 membrane protein [Paraburkholderia caballeronis]TDV18723.1 membrane protein [Paraburkholderia caballeronis]